MHEIVSIHHADAIGGDADFDTLARELVQLEYFAEDVACTEQNRPRRTTASYKPLQPTTYPHDELDAASQPTIYLHPFTPCKNRAYCDRLKRLVRVNEQGYAEYDTEVFTEQSYKASVRNIIKVSDTIIACPPCADMQPKVSTWTSIMAALDRPNTRYRPFNVFVVHPGLQDMYYSLRPDETMPFPTLRSQWVPVCKDTLQCFLCRSQIPSKTYYDMIHIWILVEHAMHGRNTLFYCSRCKLIHDFSTPTPYRTNRNHDWVSLHTLNSSI